MYPIWVASPCQCKMNGEVYDERFVVWQRMEKSGLATECKMFSQRVTKTETALQLFISTNLLGARGKLQKGQALELSGTSISSFDPVPFMVDLIQHITIRIQKYSGMKLVKCMETRVALTQQLVHCSEYPISHLQIISMHAKPIMFKIKGSTQL